MLTDSDKLTINKFLNEHTLQSVWNDTLSEYRTNYNPTLLADIAQMNTVTIGNDIVSLPGAVNNVLTPTVTLNSYYCYKINHHNLQGLYINDETWQPLDTFLNISDLQIIIYDNKGLRLFRNKIYIRKYKTPDCMLIAIDAVMANTILGTTFNKSKIYITTYFDADITNPITINSAIPLNNTELAAIDLITPSTILVNGYEINNPVLGTDVNINDYVETISDTNIIGTFEVDLSDSNMNRRFISNLDNRERYIVHTPIAMNPNKYAITHNTCEFYVRSRNTNTKKGIYLHRAQGDNNSINNITHQDFSIPKYIIDAIQGTLDDSEVIIHVLVRTHSTVKIIDRDKNYIDMLYYHNDDQLILDFLEGKNDNFNLTNWYAVNLEASDYTNALFNIIPYNNVSINSLPDYLNIYGYYATLDKICTRVHRYFIPSGFTYTMQIPKPLVYSSNVELLIAIDGKFISPSVYSHLVTGNVIDITFNNTLITINTGSEVIIQVFEITDNSMFLYYPDNITNSWNIPYGDIECLMSPNNTNEYVKLPLGPPEYTISNVSPGIYNIQFHPISFNKNYIVRSSNYSFRTETNIDSLLITNDILKVDVGQAATNSPGNILPIQDLSTSLVYLNGLELVENIDYKWIIGDVNDSLLHQKTQIVITNLLYLLPTGNTVYIRLGNETTRFTMYGFTQNQSVNAINQLPYWRDNLSNLSIRGDQILTISDGMGTITTPGITSPNVGKLWQTKTILHKDTVDYFDSYLSDISDYNTYIKIKNYYNTNTPPDNSMVILTESHKVYSVTIAAIAKDIVNGILTLAYDTIDALMLAQIDNYLYLKNYDIINDNLDLKYVDIHQHYNALSIPANQILALTRVTELLLGADTITDGDMIAIP